MAISPVPERSIFLLDVGALARVPLILAGVPKAPLSEPVLMLPTQVLEEVKERATHSTLYKHLLDLIEASRAKSYLKVVDVPLYNVFAESGTSGKALITLALENRSPGVHPVVFTNDAVLSRDCRRYGVTVARTLDIRFYSLFVIGRADPELTKIVLKILREQRARLVRSVVVGLLGAALLALAPYYLSPIVATISVWGILVVLITASFVLYWVRGHRRFEYAVAEFGIGVAIVANVLWPNFNFRVPVSATLIQDPASVLQLAGGLYVMVRGLDNLEKGMEHTFPPLHERWTRFFQRHHGPSVNRTETKR